MIRGFDNYTAPLTAAEKEQVVPQLVGLIKWRKGRSLAITNGELREMLRTRGFRVSDAKLRALINHIRTNGFVERLIASSFGYYIAESASELADYCDSLREREAAIRAVRQALESQNTHSLFG